MNNSKGFILIETLLAMFFVTLLALGALQLIISAGKISERSQRLALASQIAAQEIGGSPVQHELYSVQRQSAQQGMAQGVSMQKTIISVYDRQSGSVILSFVVYE